MAKQYSPKLKFQIAMEVLTGDKKSSQVAKAYGVRPNIQSRHSLVDDLHPSPLTRFGWTDAPLVGFYLTCSQQQLVVPQGIRDRLVFRLSAPDTLRPQPSRYLQAYHTQPLGSGGWLTLAIFVPGGVPRDMLTCEIAPTLIPLFG
jgi:hypothetical protein